jgi:mRNA-degrading endonuclease toxin of MazEF toxin-antitoxin module
VVTSGYVSDSGNLVSPKVCDQKPDLPPVGPIANRAKPYPFEMTVPGGHGVTGAVLADQ